MDKIFRKNLLYDFYGELLTEHQRKIYEAVVFDDYSLSEVAEQEDITRQGVHDMIRRCQKSLLGYEEKLGLVEKFRRTKLLLKDINDAAGAFRADGDMEHISEIERLCSEIEGI